MEPEVATVSRLDGAVHTAEQIKLAKEERFKANKDGRKKAWWVKRIDYLEAELAGKDAKVSDRDWSNGFVACMHQFQIMSKATRRQIYEQLKQHGPGYAKQIKGARFRGFSI